MQIVHYFNTKVHKHLKVMFTTLFFYLLFSLCFSERKFLDRKKKKLIIQSYLFICKRNRKYCISKTVKKAATENKKGIQNFHEEEDIESDN